MRALSFVTAFVLAAMLAGLVPSPAKAQGDACFRLWVQRNSIYKAHGYCFKTSKAIRYFGNAGCRYDYEGDVPLSPGERARIADIQAEERDMGCR
jgi:YARHG domain